MGKICFEERVGHTINCVKGIVRNANPSPYFDLFNIIICSLYNIAETDKNMLLFNYPEPSPGIIGHFCVREQAWEFWRKSAPNPQGKTDASSSMAELEAESAAEELE